MTVKELIKELEKKVSKGYGNKDIVIDDNVGDWHIDSVQKNTHIDVEPEYLIIMRGEIRDE